jgi:hypothetical protein
LSCRNLGLHNAQWARNGGDGQMTLTNTSDHAETNTSDDGAADKSIEAQMEGEIRQFVRRDIATVRPKPKNDTEMVANNIGSLLQRVAGTSVQEIDNLIVELQTLRERLENEGARVQRKITEYANLSQAAMQSTRVIAESLTHWKKG